MPRLAPKRKGEAPATRVPAALQRGLARTAAALHAMTAETPDTSAVFSSLLPSLPGRD